MSTDHKTASVLVVDDDARTRDIIATYLRRAGYAPIVAFDGQDALELIETESIDLVLLDIMMPDIDGYDVLARIFSHPLHRNLPVVVISAIDELDSIIRCIELGAEDYILKPVSPRLLIARVRASLEKKYLRDRQHFLLEELALLQNIDRELNASLDLERVMQITLDSALKRSSAHAGLIGVHSSQGIRIMAHHGYVGSAPRIGDVISYQSLNIGEYVGGRSVIHLRESTSGERHGLSKTADAWAVVPICRETESIAVLLLECNESHYCGDATLDFLSRLREHSAMAITNAQYYAAAKEANIAKSEFIGFTSHELKNLMHNVRGYAEMLTGELTSIDSSVGGMLRSVEAIRFNIDLMDKMLRDLTDISRIETHRLNLEFAPVSLAAVMDDVLLSFGSSFNDKKLALDLDVPEKLPRLRADRTRLIQILTNLISNAQKYTPYGGHIVICAQLHANSPSDAVQIEVSDNGFGIADVDKPRIFQRFFRASDNQVRSLPGTGLGLNIVRSLIELHGGQIWFNSEYGKGTQFYFTCPVFPDRQP